MADELALMDDFEDEEKTEAVKQETEQAPASLESEEVVEKEEDSQPPASFELDPDPLETTPVSAAPPPTLEAHAADEGDEVPVSKPVVAQQPQRTLDLFEDDEPPAAQSLASQVHPQPRV